jgi:Protein of unknown function (DUF3551)
MNTVRKIADSAAKTAEAPGYADPICVAASSWRRDIKKLLAVLAVAAVTAPPALTASKAQHSYAQSREAGDYKFCLRGTGTSATGCAFNTLEQCRLDNIGRGGYCYAK